LEGLDPGISRMFINGASGCNRNVVACAARCPEMIAQVMVGDQGLNHVWKQQIYRALHLDVIQCRIRGTASLNVAEAGHSVLDSALEDTLPVYCF